RPGPPTGSPSAVASAFTLMASRRQVLRRQPNARNADRATRSRSAASARPPARRSGAATPAWNHSNASSATRLTCSCEGRSPVFFLDWTPACAGVLPLRETSVLVAEYRVAPAVAVLVGLAHRCLVDVYSEAWTFRDRQIAFNRSQRF